MINENSELLHRRKLEKFEVFELYAEGASRSYALFNYPVTNNEYLTKKWKKDW